MDDQIYLDEPYLSIRWRSVPQILFAEWKGYATSEEFRAALLKGVQAIREHHVVGYVSDARKAKVFVAEDMKWVSEVWLPQALKAGLKRMAMVTAEEGLGKAIIEDVTREINNHGLAMRKFNSVASATVWAQCGLGG
jgi:hypothetical protein